MSVTLLHHDTFDITQLTIHKLLETSDKLISDLSINSKSLIFFINQLPVIKFTQEVIVARYYSHTVKYN